MVVHDVRETKGKEVTTRCNITSVMIKSSIWLMDVTCPECLK